MHLAGWRRPVPMPGPVNTAGAEDSPFITPDGAEFYFFFTPDMHIPVTRQSTDGVTGIWTCRLVDGAWSEPERVMLHDFPCLEGCAVVASDVMWFGAVCAKNFGEIDIYTARRDGGRWTDIRNAGRQLNIEYDIGELHVTAGGFRVTVGGVPENLGPRVNTADWEGQPFVTPGEDELWFTGLDRLGVMGTSVWRSLRNPDGTWGTAELVVSGFAGEPCLDARGNLYFVHHLFHEGQLTEAEIYVADKR